MCKFGGSVPISEPVEEQDRVLTGETTSCLAVLHSIWVNPIIVETSLQLCWIVLESCLLNINQNPSNWVSMLNAFSCPWYYLGKKVVVHHDVSG